MFVGMLDWFRPKPVPPSPRRRPRVRRAPPPPPVQQPVQQELIPLTGGLGPRADFTCPACGPMELPVKAQVCPVCSGGLERLYNAVNVSAQGGHEKAQMVDTYAVQALEQVRKGAPRYPQEMATRPGGGVGVLGMIPPDGKQWSRSWSTNTIRHLGDMGGPAPGPGSMRG
jgi:hypothetical protein